jgi:hypothetical protein
MTKLEQTLDVPAAVSDPPPDALSASYRSITN